MKSITAGVFYLHHEKKFLHRDLQARSVVLMDPENDLSNLRIEEFGQVCDDDSEN